MEGFQDLIERYDHVSMAVWDITACREMVELMAGEFLDGGDSVRNRFRWVQYRIPGPATIEFIQPLEGNDWLTRHLERRGEGVHHLTFKVTELDAAVRRAADLGLETTGYHRTPEWSEVFIHPRSAHGVVIQLAEWADGKRWAESLDQVLAGEAIDSG